MQGNHDAKTIDEVKSYNTNNNISFTTLVNLQSLLSNTLVANAYNINDELVDSIKFLGNYPLTKIIFNDYENLRTEVSSQTLNATLSIISSGDDINNNLQLYIDDHDFLFNLGISSGTSIDIVSLASSLNSKIRAEIYNNLSLIKLGYTHELWTAYLNNHVFVTCSNGKITFISPKYGERSRIKFLGESETAAYNFVVNYC